MSRPEKEIDWDRFEELLLAGCNGPEISPHFDMHPTTLYGKVEEKYKMNFTAYSQQKRAQGDSCLREVQYKKALSGDNTMLVWLGKNRLKQSESPQEINISGEANTQFNAIMTQLSSLQSTRKILDNIESSPNISP